MRQLSLFGLVLIVAPSIAFGQNALERMLQCEQRPNPTSLVLAMKKAGIIDEKPPHGMDSMAFWRPVKPLTVWGYRVKAVFAFDQNPKLFPRMPGTAPPILVGVVVPYPIESVKAHVQTLGHVAVRVEPGFEFAPVSSRVDTWITCSRST